MNQNTQTEKTQNRDATWARNRTFLPHFPQAQRSTGDNLWNKVSEHPAVKVSKYKNSTLSFSKQKNVNKGERDLTEPGQSLAIKTSTESAFKVKEGLKILYSPSSLGIHSGHFTLTLKNAKLFWKRQSHSLFQTHEIPLKEIVLWNKYYSQIQTGYQCKCCLKNRDHKNTVDLNSCATCNFSVVLPVCLLKHDLCGKLISHDSLCYSHTGTTAPHSLLRVFSIFF